MIIKLFFLHYSVGANQETHSQSQEDPSQMYQGHIVNATPEGQLQIQD